MYLMLAATITLCIAVLFLRFKWGDFFVLCSNLYCVFYVYGCLIKVEFHILKCLILWGLMFFVSPCIILSHQSRCSKLALIQLLYILHYCGKLDCAVGGIECLCPHHGALYNDISKTSVFDFSLASHYNLSPVDNRKSVECLCFWSVGFWESVKCRCFQGVDFGSQ